MKGRSCLPNDPKLSSVYVLAHSGFVIRCCPMAESLFILELEFLHIRGGCSLVIVFFVPMVVGACFIMVVGAIVNLQEQMVETKAWKVSIGISVGGDMCRLCGSYRETVQHLLAGCQTLAGKEYLRRHNRALMVIAVAWAKKYELIDESAVWYNEKWEKGKVLENDKGKLVWDFEYKMRQSSLARRPDLTLEDKERKRVWICDMACPQESNIEAKVKEKLDKYQQLAFEMRETRVGHRVEIVPLVIGCLGGGVGKLLKAVQSVLDTETEIEDTVKGMQKTVLMDSESMMRKVLSGVVQPQ